VIKIEIWGYFYRNQNLIKKFGGSPHNLVIIDNGSAFIYESRFEKEYGYFRPIVREVVERYLDCGNPRCGFARIRFHLSSFPHRILFIAGRFVARRAVDVQPHEFDRVAFLIKLDFEPEADPHRSRWRWRKAIVSAHDR